MTHRTAERDGASAALLEHLLEISSRTFALTIPLLPEPTRREVTLAYLLFRVADTLEDAHLWPRERKLDELAAFARLLDAPDPAAAERIAASWLAEPPCAHDGYRELLARLPVVLHATGELSPHALDCIRRHTRRTVEGMSGFVARERDGRLELRDLDDLKAYCYAVAGIVGEMLTELFLEGRTFLRPVAPALRRGAATFGEALQLVNILKDSAADSKEGRQFLPSAVPRAAVFALARRDLRAAGDYCSQLEAARAPRGIVGFTALPVLLAAATLDHVERHGAGSKLGRDAVAGIAAELQAALDDRSVSALLARAR